MKFLITSIFILMFGLMSGSAAAGCPHDGAEPPETGILALSASGTPAMADGTAVDIIYLKDKDGKPYIISIRSEDKRVNNMIRKMISAKEHAGTKAFPAGAEETLAITFYYDNIR